MPGPPSTNGADASSSLQEDVTRLLAWGRDALAAQRRQRRESASGLAHPSPPAPSPWRQQLSDNATLGATVSCTSSLDVPYTADQARQRLAQLAEVEAENTRVFHRRWALLCRGRERLLRERAHPQTPSPRARELQQLTATAQAVVEAEASLTDVLREVLLALAQLCEQQQRQRPPHHEAATAAAEVAHLPSVHGLVHSVHGGEHVLSDSDAEGPRASCSSLRQLTDAVAHRARLVLDAHRRAEHDRAAQRAVAVARQRRHAASVQRLQHQLASAKAALEAAAHEETQRRQELLVLQAERAAAQRAAAMNAAHAHRERETRASLARLEQLQQEATAQSAIARQALAASEARHAEVTAAHDAALRDHHAAAEELAAAQHSCRDSVQKRDDADLHVRQVRQSCATMRDKCEELRSQRAQVAEDCMAAQDALRYQRTTHHDSGTSEDDDSGNGGGSAAAAAADNVAAELSPWPQHDQQTPSSSVELHLQLQQGDADLAALQAAEAEVRNAVQRGRMALEVRRRQNAALEAHLVQVNVRRSDDAATAATPAL
ncbi:hypothetical protein NESM_000378100 [Novymonas esmeraldas]|uniref:Uncharacterized protein n=1 Tax=Novymonas esmeraldas TaxID=1808958 RepID=A0AAW0EP42_9TRYP